MDNKYDQNKPFKIAVMRGPLATLIANGLKEFSNIELSIVGDPMKITDDIQVMICYGVHSKHCLKMIRKCRKLDIPMLVLFNFVLGASVIYIPKGMSECLYKVLFEDHLVYKDNMVPERNFLDYATHYSKFWMHHSCQWLDWAIERFEDSSLRNTIGKYSMVTAAINTSYYLIKGMPMREYPHFYLLSMAVQPINKFYVPNID